MKNTVLILIVAAVLAQPASGQQTQFRPVSLDEALQLAVDNGLTMHQARDALDDRKMNLRLRYAAFLPTLSGNIGARKPQDTWQFSSSFQANLNIFDYNLYFNIGQAKRQLETQQWQMITTRYQVALTVKQQFNSAIQATETLNAAQQALEISRTNHELAKARVRSGSGVETDSLASSINLANAEISVMEAEQTVVNSRRTLSRTLGVDELVEPDLSSIGEFQLVQLDSLALEGMLDNTPAMHQSRASIAEARHSLRSAKFQYIPRIGGGYGYSRSGSGESVFGYDDRRYNYNGGINYSFSLSVQIFNGFSRENQLHNSVQQVNLAERQYQDQIRQQRQTFYTQLSQIRVLERQMLLQERQLASAEQAMRVDELRYNMGLNRQVDVLNTQNQLAGVRRNIINTRNSYRNAIAQLEQLLGTDLR